MGENDRIPLRNMVNLEQSFPKCGIRDDLKSRCTDFTLTMESHSENGLFKFLPSTESLWLMLIHLQSLNTCPLFTIQLRPQKPTGPDNIPSKNLTIFFQFHYINFNTYFHSWLPCIITFPLIHIIFKVPCGFCKQK